MRERERDRDRDMEIGIKRRGGGVGMEKLTDRETEAKCDGKDERGE